MENKIAPKLLVFLSFIVGFLSLAQEIVWVKLVSFLGHSVPSSFSFVLFIYILGIAIGAHKGKTLITSQSPPNVVIAKLLLSTGLISILTPMAITYSSSTYLFLLVITLLILANASFKGAIFPLVHHLYSQPGQKLGRTLSTVYFANVAGSSLGPLIVGFILLDMFSTIELLVYIGIIELIIASYLLFKVTTDKVILILVLALPLSAYSLTTSLDTLQKIIEKNFDSKTTVLDFIENKHGVIYTTVTDKNKPRVYGGNVYDGAFNVSLTDNVNGIDRAFLLSTLHESPKNILFIGLSSGSWLRVAASLPSVENIDVIEINPAYEQLISKQPGAEILSDPRINIEYTDGRQTVKSSMNQGKTYDLIIMNTTWHWRAYATNLLSADYFMMVNKIMNDKSVFAFNSTDSTDVFYTASRTFKYTYRYKNFIYASKSNLKKMKKKYSDNLCNLDPKYIDGQNCDLEDFNNAINSIKKKSFVEWPPEQKTSTRQPELITDDNMIIEYKYGRTFKLQ